VRLFAATYSSEQDSKESELVILNLTVNWQIELKMKNKTSWKVLQERFKMQAWSVAEWY